MAASTFDVTQQPNPSGVGKPSSGTYGEGAALDRLKQALPQVKPPPGPGGAGAPPMPMPSGPAPSTPAPAGLPDVLAMPTQRPDVPVSTPLSAPPVNPVQAAATSRQRNMAILDALANSPTASETTRRWAAELIRTLVGASKA